MNISEIRRSIPAVQNTIYLNSGASAPSPRSVLDAVTSYLERQAAEGPFAPPVLQEELRVEAALRAAIAGMLGADHTEITLCNNTTDGINLVSGGVDWREGDEVITCDQEHPSGLLPWFYLRDRFGIRVKVVSIPTDGKDVARVFEEAITPRTRLICVSHVSWCTGLLLAIRNICRAAHRHGVAVVVDGAQGPGHIPVNAKELDCDFYALSGQKWLMGPHGSGGLYISSRAQWQPQLSHLGWASASKVTPDGSYTLFPDGRRYEYATTNHGLHSGLIEALRLYAVNGPEEVWQRILELSDGLEARIRRLPGIEIVSPRGPGLSTGLLAFRLPGRNVQDVVERLWVTHRIACRWVDPVAIRMSLHIFNTEDELDRVAQALAEFG